MAAAPWLVGRRILLVDDDPMVRTAMRALLDWLQPHFPQAFGVLLPGELLQVVQQRAEEAG